MYRTMQKFDSLKLSKFNRIMMDDLSDPYANYTRLIKTRDFIKSGETIHERFYDIHIMYIRKYLEVLQTTEDCDQTATPYLHSLVIQYDTSEMFDLKLYLEVLEILIRTVQDYDFQRTFDTMGIH